MAHAPIQREFPDNQGIIQSIRRQLRGGNQNPYGNWQIVGRAGFAHGGRGQVDGYPFAGEFHPRVFDGSFDAFAALLYSSIGQADDGDMRHTAPGIDLHFDDHPIKSNHSTGEHTGKHESSVDGCGGNVNALS